MCDLARVSLLLLAWSAVSPSQVRAQETPDRQEVQGRFMLEAGIVEGGGSDRCPGQYIGINGRVAGPVSLYGMVETSRCADRTGSARRFGASVLLGRSSWLVRPALRGGIEFQTNYVGLSGGASLTLGGATGRASSSTSRSAAARPVSGSRWADTSRSRPQAGHGNHGDRSSSSGCGPWPFRRALAPTIADISFQ